MGTLFTGISLGVGIGTGITSGIGATTQNTVGGFLDDIAPSNTDVTVDKFNAGV